jgi:DNA-binding response OmpR family regulator
MAYVLIVDDDADFSHAVSTVLEASGHRVRAEFTASGGLKSLLETKPDLVVLDVMFPEDASAGFVLARKIRQVGGALKDVPILMLTAVNQKFPLGFGPRDIDPEWLPVTDFIEKPVDLAILASRVRGMLKTAAQ